MLHKSKYVKLFTLASVILTILFSGALTQQVVAQITYSGVGESVNVTYTFPTQYVYADAFDVSYGGWDAEPTITTEDMHFIYTSDNQRGIIKAAYAAEGDSVATLTTLFYVSTRVGGLFTCEWYTIIEHAGGTITFSEEVDTFTITANYISRDGTSIFRLYSRSNTGSHLTTLYILDVTDDTWDVIDQDSDATASGTVDSISTVIDQIKFEAADIDAIVRSDYSFENPEKTLHKVIVPNFDYAVGINITHPTHWEYANCTPSATITEGTGYLYAASTVALNYEFRFVADDSLRISNVNELFAENYESSGDEYVTVFGGTASKSVTSEVIINPADAIGDAWVVWSHYIVSGTLTVNGTDYTATGAWTTTIKRFTSVDWLNFTATDAYIDSVCVYNNTLTGIKPLTSIWSHITPYGLSRASYDTIYYTLYNSTTSLDNSSDVTDLYGNWQGSLNPITAGSYYLWTHSGRATGFTDSSFVTWNSTLNDNPWAETWKYYHSGGNVSGLASYYPNSLGYAYRKSHGITGSSGAGTNYQIRLEVHSGSGSDSSDVVYLGGHCIDFPNDIRFTDNDGSTLLDFWIEDTTADPIVVWVEVQDNLDSSQSIYIYYGKTGDTTTSNGVNTFLFFDGFSGASYNSTKWWTGGDMDEDEGSITVTGGFCRIVTDDSAWKFVGLLANTGTNVDHETIWRLRWSTPLYWYQPIVGAHENYQSSIRNARTAGWEFYNQWAYSTTGPSHNHYLVTGDGTSAQTSWDHEYENTETWLYWKQTMDYGVGVYSWNSSTATDAWDTAFSNTVNIPQASTTLRPFFAVSANTGAGDYMDVDYVFMKKYVSTPPTHGSWGTEEYMSATLETSSGHISFEGVDSDKGGFTEVCSIATATYQFLRIDIRTTHTTTIKIEATIGSTYTYTFTGLVSGDFTTVYVNTQAAFATGTITQFRIYDDTNNDQDFDVDNIEFYRIDNYLAVGTNGIACSDGTNLTMWATDSSEFAMVKTISVNATRYPFIAYGVRVDSAGQYRMQFSNGTWYNLDYESTTNSFVRNLAMVTYGVTLTSYRLCVLGSGVNVTWDYVYAYGIKNWNYHGGVFDSAANTGSLFMNVTFNSTNNDHLTLYNTTDTDIIWACLTFTCQVSDVDTQFSVNVTYESGAFSLFTVSPTTLTSYTYFLPISETTIDWLSIIVDDVNDASNTGDHWAYITALTVYSYNDADNISLTMQALTFTSPTLTRYSADEYRFSVATEAYSDTLYNISINGIWAACDVGAGDLVTINNALGTHAFTAYAIDRETFSGDWHYYFIETSATSAYTVSDRLVRLALYSSVDGFGLSFDTCKVYVNGSRVYDGIYFAESNVLNITVLSYFDEQLLMQNYTIGSDVTEIWEIDLAIGLYEMIFANEGSNKLEYIIVRNGITQTLIVGAGMAVTYRLPNATYSLTVNGLAYDGDTGVVSSRTEVFSDSDIILPNVEGLIAFFDAAWQALQPSSSGSANLGSLMIWFVMIIGLSFVTMLIVILRTPDSSQRHIYAPQSPEPRWRITSGDEEELKRLRKTRKRRVV